MKARGGGLIRLACLGVAAALVSTAPQAQEIPQDLFAPQSGSQEDLPALISADQVSYDENAKIITATGNVEISQGERVVLADEIKYDTQAEVVDARGNITLLDSTGHVVFAERAELTGDLREGFIRQIRVLLSDQSRLAGTSALRVGGNRTELRNAVFSPCLPCEEDPEAAPIWQIKALRVVHDQEEKVIKYRDAWFEVFGVPVAYTPYFQHPDPTVKRKSGFLAPSIGSSTELGTRVQVPYFWAISEDRDLTIDPIFTTDQSIVLNGAYRQVVPDGELILRGSATIADREITTDVVEPDKLRGHIDGSGRFDINETWRWGFDLNRSTDDTYLRVYDFGTDRTLTSGAFVEGFRGRNYASVKNFLYQGQRTGDINGEFPIILPLMDYSFISEPGLTGGIYRLDANFLNIVRDLGRESRRASIVASWELPHTSPAGDVVTLRAQVAADGYHLEGVDPNSEDPNPAGNTEDGFTGRFMPQLALEWRYPWISDAAGFSQIVEPIVQGVVAPGWPNPGLIPNEDSLDFEFDDTNIFSLNRFPGRDRVDSSSRVDYGLKWTATGETTGYASAFVGQSYRLVTDDIFRENSGLADNFSDYVGRLQLKPHPYADLSYRFRLDKDDLKVQRNEISLSLGPPALQLFINYLDLAGGVNEELFAGREEVNIVLSSKLSDNWSAFISHQRNLRTDEELESTLGLVYEDECFLLTGQFFRKRFEDREIAPEDVVLFTVGLKHLGQFTSQ